MSDNREKPSFGHEQKDPGAIERAGAERSKELLEQYEKVGEKSPEKSVESARHDIEQATRHEREHLPREVAEKQVSPAERRKDGPIRKSDRDASFNVTMKEVQGQMTGPSRAFSKVIHNKAVEKVSDVAASTIARPNAILSGAVAAFVLTLAVYLIAKNYGYTLPGSQTIIAFVAGWIIGVAYDFFKVMITGRK